MITQPISISSYQNFKTAYNNLLELEVKSKGKTNAAVQLEVLITRDQIKASSTKKGLEQLKKDLRTQIFELINVYSPLLTEEEVIAARICDGRENDIILPSDFGFRILDDETMEDGPLPLEYLFSVEVLYFEKNPSRILA